MLHPCHVAAGGKTLKQALQLISTANGRREGSNSSEKSGAGDSAVLGQVDKALHSSAAEDVLPALLQCQAAAREACAR